MHEENGLAEQGWRTIVTMKDSMLIDSSLSNNFWAEAMETASYLRNRLPTRSKNHGEVILEESWTRRQQSLGNVCIFGSLVLANIPEEKRTKSDYQKVWQGILIGYSPDTPKYFRVWVPQTKQVIIVSEPYIDKSEQGAKLLEKWPIEASSKQKAPTGEQRPRGRPRKYLTLEQLAAQVEMTTAALLETIPWTDNNGGNGDNNNESLGGHKTAMSITESTSKICERKAYDKAINDLIHWRQWREAIKDELQNLESHHTWEYKKLPLGRKTIGS